MEDEGKAGEQRPSRTGPPSLPLKAPSAPERTAPPANYRIAAALFWIVLQATLIVTADRRVDGAFGFRMFSESSSIKLALFREVDGSDGKRVRVHVQEGMWSARASDGKNHRLSWYDRVPMPHWIFDQEMHASYGASTQLSRLQGALDDLASHIAPSDDLETRRFILDVTVRRNGREPVEHELVSRERTGVPVPEPAPDGGL
jgi:hypothetical protein